MEKFKQLGLSAATLVVLEKKGYTEPTQIQKQTIPLLLEGKFDVVGQAQTGTGKTASFALPILETIKRDTKKIQAIILTPTRELAVQVASETQSLNGGKRLTILAIYGGASISDQIRTLKSGVHIVVGTPGRVKDLINRGNLDISDVSFAVLDEADEMLNMGFVEDIEDILSKTPHEKRMMLFSATMPNQILKIAKRFMKEYKLVKIEKKTMTLDLTEQIYYDIRGRDRYEALVRIMAVTDGFHGIIFCKTRRETGDLARKLERNNYPAAALHGEVSQGQREHILREFKKKNITILVATDVAARGIDVDNLTHVINFSLPQSAETYVHRVGRTGRAGKKGTAITFVIPSEKGKLRIVERLIKKKLEKRELPSVKEVVNLKRDHLIAKLRKIIESSKTTKYDEMVDQLLHGNNPNKVIAALLNYSFQDQLDEGAYKNVEKLSESELRPARSDGTGRGGGSRGGSRGGSHGGGSKFGGRGGSRGGGSKFGGRGGSRDGGSKFGGRGGSRDGGSRGGRTGGGRGGRGGGSESRRSRDSGSRDSGSSSRGGRSRDSGRSSSYGGSRDGGRDSGRSRSDGRHGSSRGGNRSSGERSGGRKKRRSNN